MAAKPRCWTWFRTIPLGGLQSCFSRRLILVLSLSLELEGVHVSLTCLHYPILRLGGENPSMSSLH